MDACTEALEDGLSQLPSGWLYFIYYQTESESEVKRPISSIFRTCVDVSSLDQGCESGFDVVGRARG